MPVGGRLQLIKKVLYRLKRSYGCPIAVYRQSPQTIDLATGKSSITRTSIEIKRAVVLPSKIHRGFTFDIGYLKANSNFTYGAVYTDATREIIIDRHDLPKGYTLDATDEFYVVYQGKRWEIKVVEEFEFNLAYYLTLARVDGAIVNAIINERVRDHLVFAETVDAQTSDFQFIHRNDTLTFAQTVATQVIRSPQLQHTLTFTEGNNVV